MRIRHLHHSNHQPVSVEKPRRFHLPVFIASVIFVLVAANIWIFALSVQLTDAITRLEEKTITLSKSNDMMHEKMYQLSSYDVLAYTAHDMGFTKEAEPFSLESSDLASAR